MGRLEQCAFPKWIRRFCRRYCRLTGRMNLFDDRTAGGARYLLWGEPGCGAGFFRRASKVCQVRFLRWVNWPGGGRWTAGGAMRIPKTDQEILQTVLPAYREDEFV
jgi:hypothetical protein